MQPAIYKEVMETRPVGHAQAAGHDDVAEMAHAMEAARRFEIVADTTQALNANWGKIHNPWKHARANQNCFIPVTRALCLVRRIEKYYFPIQ